MYTVLPSDDTHSLTHTHTLTKGHALSLQLCIYPVCIYRRWSPSNAVLRRANGGQGTGSGNSTKYYYITYIFTFNIHARGQLGLTHTHAHHARCKDWANLRPFISCRPALPSRPTLPSSFSQSHGSLEDKHPDPPHPSNLSRAHL